MNFQTVSTGQKLPTSRTNGDLSGSAAGGYLADGATPGPVLTNALDFVDQSLGKMVSALGSRGLLNSTAIIVSAKHGQSPMNLAALNRIDDGKIIAALNAAWNSSQQRGNPKATPLVAFGVDDDGIILWLNDRSIAATEFARQFLANYQDPTASVDGKPVKSAGLWQVYTGVAAAQLIGVSQSDPRVPDVIGIAQYGVVYTSHKSKIAEHGGDHPEDRNVPIVVAWPGATSGLNVKNDANRPDYSGVARSSPRGAPGGANRGHAATLLEPLLSINWSRRSLLGEEVGSSLIRFWGTLPIRAIGPRLARPAGSVSRSCDQFFRRRGM